MKAYLLFLICISFQSLVLGQSPFTNPDSITKASYLGDDLVLELANNIQHPQNIFTKETEGDVILRVRIDKNGKLQNPTCNYAATLELGESAIDAIQNLKHNWKPALLGDIAISKSYLIVYRYRINENNRPPNTLSTINKKIRKEKYDHALSLINTAIADNDFDANNFLKRAEILTLMNLEEEAKAALLHAEKLQAAVLAIVDFALIREKTVGTVSILVARSVPNEFFRVAPRNH